MRALSYVNQRTSLCAAYQTEIDNLTKRSKAAESAFLNVYKVFAEAPDPYPLLEAAVVCLTCHGYGRDNIHRYTIGSDREGRRGARTRAGAPAFP